MRILAWIALVALAAAKNPITHEDVWLMKRAGAPVVSPDGKWVVFSLVEPAYDAKEQVSDLWVVPADASAKARRLTATKTGESGAAWSPDSRKIAFSAKRDGDEEAQIYVLDLGGGEAVRVTAVSTGASSPVWSPDGKSILFTSSVYPGAADDAANKKAAAERKARKHTARVYESFPIRYWDHWLDERQPHLLVQAAESGAKARDLLAGTKLAGEAGFGGVFGLSSEDLPAVWSPDGQSVVFAATVNRNAAAYDEVVTNLYAAPAGGGEPKAITSGKDSYSRPTFRPDGRALYAIVNRAGEKVYYLDRLVMFAWPNPGERTVVSASLDRSVNSFALTPDSRSIHVTAEEHGHEKLFTLPAGGGEAKPAFEVSSGVYTNLSGGRASAVLAANWESAVSPAEVVRIDPASGRRTPLTDFNAAKAAEIDWQPLREFWHTSKGGKRIHSMIALPPDFREDRKYPLLVFMHGGPHSMWRDQFFLRWNYHFVARPGYVVLMTNYTGSTGFGESFAQEIQGDPLRGPAEEINEAADEAIRRFPFIDAARQAAGGASYGGHLANWMQATTARYKCLFSHAGLVNLESQWGTSDVIWHRERNNGGPVWEQGRIWREQNPIRYAKNFRTPMLLTIGENDYRVPLNQTIENWSVLQRLRIPSKLVVFPDENHWILKGENNRFFFQQVHSWLEKYLK
ncbi:MAG: S9 family peptidase [Bryobacteraceae bacterium]